MSNRRVVRDESGQPIRMEIGSTLEQQLAWQIRCAKLPAPTRELHAIPGRRFRFDFAWPDRKLAVEVQGAVWTAGRHTRGAGAEKDAEKLSLAVLHGWRVLIITGKQIKSGEALNWIERGLKANSTETAA